MVRCKKKIYIYIYIYLKKLKEQLDKHIKLKDKKKTALHEFSSSYETSSGKIKLQMLLLLYDKELTRDCTKAINIYKRNFYKNGHKAFVQSLVNSLSYKSSNICNFILPDEVS